MSNKKHIKKMVNRVRKEKSYRHKLDLAISGGLVTKQSFLQCEAARILRRLSNDLISKSHDLEFFKYCNDQLVLAATKIRDAKIEQLKYFNSFFNYLTGGKKFKKINKKTRTWAKKRIKRN